MDGTFHAIATILHHVPRGANDPRGRRRPDAQQRDGQEPLRDMTEGWIRVAL